MKCSLCGRENPQDRFRCKYCGFPLRNIENLPPGEEIKGRFQVIQFLGKGGMGVIYKVRDKKLNRVVALKILPLELKEDEKARKRFLREAQAAAQLEHPNICTIYEIYESDDIDFIVMQYIEGKDLRKILREEGPFPPWKFLNYAKQMASALEVAHQRGIIHRDIKPSNIMITPRGQVKILDFGLAKFAGAEDSLTSADVVVGTLAYMSPEQCRGEKLTPASDVFSMGIVFYEMLTGKNPFRGEDAGSTFYKLLHEMPHPPSRLLPLPPGLDTVVMKALAKVPSERFQNGGELLRALESIKPQEESLESTLPTSRPRTLLKRSPLRFLPVAVLLIGLVAALGLIRILGPPEPMPSSIVVRDFSVGKGVSAEAADVLSFLLRKKLLLLKNITVIDEETFGDLRRRFSQEEVFKRFKIIGVISGEIKKYGKMVSLEATLSKGGEIYPITVSGEGEASLLEYQVDSLGEKIATLLSLKFSRKKPLRDMTTSSYRALVFYIEAKKAWEKLSVSRAKNLVQKALSLDNNFPLAHFLKAKILVFLDEIEKAKKEVLFAARNGNSSLLEVDLWKIKALQAELNMNFREKIRYLEKVKNRDPYDRHSYYELAEAYFHRASPRKAIPLYQKALELKEDFLPVLNHLGYCYLYLGEHLKGIQYFEKYKMLSNEANAFDSLGDGYFYSGNYLEAITNKETALEKDPSLTWIYHSLAYILFLKGAVSRAAKYNSLYFARARDKKSRARAFVQRAFFKMELGKPGAERDIERALSLYDPEEPHILIPELHWVALQIYLKKGDMKRACHHLKWMERTVRKFSVGKENYFPLYKFYLHGKAECLLARDDLKGFSYYEKLMEIKDKLGYWATPFERAYFTGLKALQEIKFRRLARARLSLKDGFSYNPNHPLLLLARILILKTEGKREEFSHRVEELLSFYRSYPPADPDYTEGILKRIKKAPGGS